MKLINSKQEFYKKHVNLKQKIIVEFHNSIKANLV